ncbi:MAG: FAD:protein FMN transferase [Gemmatimonadaceae bacterium]|nr:FAD:protein FMN transferase [Gemmatimonadaceae bacterium]
MTAARATFSISQASWRWWVMLFALVGASLYAYRTRERAGPTVARFGGPAQGSTYSVVLNGGRPDSVVSSLKSAVDSLLADVDAQMSTYDSASELSRLNRDTANTPVVLSAPLAEVMRQSIAVSQASGGAFDVTVGPLVDAWGFGPAGVLTRVPDSTMLDALRARVGWQKLRLEGESLTKGHPHLEIDLSAIAQGYTVDLISALLSARGEANHFVEVGGEVRARGRNAQGMPFRVGIEQPDVDRRSVRLVVGLADRALATSGNYRDFHDVDGVRYVHTIDPATGKPVRHRLLAASVLHQQCSLADAWATALMVVGPERAWAMAEANRLEVLLLVAGPNGEVQERMTAGFRAAVIRDGEPKRH